MMRPLLHAAADVGMPHHAASAGRECSLLHGCCTQLLGGTHDARLLWFMHAAARLAAQRQQRGANPHSPPLHLLRRRTQTVTVRVSSSARRTILTLKPRGSINKMQSAENMQAQLRVAALQRHLQTGGTGNPLLETSPTAGGGSVRLQRIDRTWNLLSASLLS